MPRPGLSGRLAYSLLHRYQDGAPVIAQRALLYLRDFLVIVACLLAGKTLAVILPFAFPGSIIGMLLLFVLLSLQLVKLHWVELGAGLLLRHMGSCSCRWQSGWWPGWSPCANPSASSCSASCSGSC